jgi:tetratricopeptide (TPR) repeat protein
MVVVALIATIVGPPLVDYLTQPDDDSSLDVDEDTQDPVEEEYRAQIAANPDDPAAFAALANYLGNTGRVDEAIGWYERALELEPNNLITRLGFARVLSNGGKRPDAELQFKKVLEACPVSEQTWFSLGQLYANWVPPRTSDAIQAYEAVIVYGPETFVAERAREELATLGVASPVPASPVAVIAAGSPVVSSEQCP